MVSYVVYDKSGKIISAAQGADIPKETVDNENTFILECDFNVFDIQNYLVEDGKLRAKTQSELDTENEPREVAECYAHRNALLAESDWTQANDSPLSESVKTNYQQYRQILRDMPQQSDFDPLNPNWPEPPA